MMQKSSTFISGVMAVGIYIFLILMLLFYFNTRDTQKPIHYVKKNEDRIRVTMATPKNETKKKEKKPTQKKEVPKKEPVKKLIKEPKAKPKETVKKQEDTRKKVIKEKIVKKVKPKTKPKEIVKKPPPKKVNKPKDLFANVSSSKKPKTNTKTTDKPVKPKVNNLIKVSQKASASDLVSSLKIQKSSDRGIENAYFALVEEKLKGWPAQSDYAGEEAKVSFRIETDGQFIFKVVTGSSNADFNEGLVAYLEQLQKFGFGPHKGGRAYQIEVKFVATE